MISPNKIWRQFRIACPSDIFGLQSVWFLVHVYVALIPNSSGQLSELIAYTIPLE